MTGMPEHIAEAVEALRAGGWVTPSEASTSTGRSIVELAILTESGEVGMIQLGPWWEDGVPREMYMVQLVRVEAAPRRPPLRAVVSS